MYVCVNISLYLIYLRCDQILYSSIGRVAVEGKVEHKFDMKPHEENIEEYGRLCRERTNKSMIKNRQIQVLHLSVHLLWL